MNKQTTTIWQFARVSPLKQREGFYCKESMCHPAKMPTNLAQAIILTYTKRGDLILDPMTGIGTTVIEAIKLGRNAIGIEYEERFRKICNKNLILTREKMGNDIGKGLFIRGDARKINKALTNSGNIDSVIFSPPYEQVVCNQTNHSGLSKKKFGYMVPYSKKPNKKMPASQINIGMQAGKDYFSEMLKVYQECHRVLKSGSLMILVVKNFRRKGEEINLMGETIQLCKIAGFKFFQTSVRVLNGASFWQITHTRNTPRLMLNLTEYILVFKKD